MRNCDLVNIEFYGTPTGDVMIKDKIRPLRMYEPSDKDFTQAMIEKINEFYPEAFKALCELYTPSKLNKDYYEYLIIHRFIRCNFSEYDNKADIDQNGIFRMEYVNCPMRGECKYCGIICNPKFNTKLSDRELEVMKLYYQSLKADEISDRLFISIETVKKHKRNSLQKLDLHSLSEFISYASRNKIFESYE